MREGDRSALDELVPLVYGELRKMASGYLRSEKPGHTLQPTALVNEVYLRLAGAGHYDFLNRTHFLGVATFLLRGLPTLARDSAHQASGHPHGWTNHDACTHGLLPDDGCVPASAGGTGVASARNSAVAIHALARSSMYCASTSRAVRAASRALGSVD